MNEVLEGKIQHPERYGVQNPLRHEEVRDTYRQGQGDGQLHRGRHPFRVVEIQGLLLLKYDAENEGAMPSIAVGRPYSSSKAQPVFPQDESAGPFKILFNEHVAQSDTKVVKTDPKFLAVTGKALGTDEKFFEVTVRTNPEYDPTVAGSRRYQTVNATQISKKTHKVTGNTTAKGAATKTKADLSTYTIVPYMSPHIGITSDQLVEEETTEYFPQLQPERYHRDSDRFRGFRTSACRAGGTGEQPQPLEKRRLPGGRGHDHVRRGRVSSFERAVPDKVRRGVSPSR